MRQFRQPYQKGKEITDAAVDLGEPELGDLMHFDKNQHAPGNRDGGFRIGKTANRMEEGEEPGGIADMNDEEVRTAAMEKFASDMKKAVSAKLMGRKTNLKLKGHPDIVNQITNLIKFEADYLNAIISGQAADTPALQKNKAIIDAEAKKLDRMLGTSDLWPFK
jgi:hypothetical protein